MIILLTSNNIYDIILHKININKGNRMEIHVEDFATNEDLYSHFKDVLKEEDVHVTNYYEIVIICARQILRDIRINTSNKVAFSLGISPTKLSHITSILKVL